MIPELQRRHRRWMVHVGQCLTVGLIPIAILGAGLNGCYQTNVRPRIPWLAFAAAVVCVFGARIGMLIWWSRLSRRYNPNDDDLESR
jgi:hypothetical protein